MAYTSLTTAETASGKPLLQALARKIKDDLDYLYGLSASMGSIVIPNGSFEIDSDADGIPDLWAKNLYAGGTGAFYTTAPAHGAKAWSFTHPGGASNGGGYLDSDYIEVTELGIYWISFIHWATVAGMRNKVQIRYFDKVKNELGAGSPADLYNSIANPTSASAFTYYNTPPATTRYIKLRLIGGFTDTDVAGTAYFDDIRFGLIANASISQAKLKTSMGSVSTTETEINLTLPGGEYGFYPQVKSSTGYSVSASLASSLAIQSYTTNIHLGAPAGGTGYAQQRYITASGEIHWVFFLRNKETKKIMASWQSPDHPCFGNGGDPDIVSHPFPGYDPKIHEIIVINSSPEEVAEIKTIDRKMDFLEILYSNYEIDETIEAEWPSIPVTVSLRDDYEMEKGIVIKRIIPKPDYIMARGLKKKAILGEANVIGG